MSRFFVDQKNIGAGTIFLDDREDLHHMIKVLRLSVGDEIDVSDGAEWEYHAVITSLDKDGGEAKILDKQKFSAEPEIKVTLFQGIPKQGKMETIVQKCVELGVNRIIPVFMVRTVVADKGNFDKKIQRWQKVSNEAVKQCRRGIIPEVSQPVKIEDVLEMFDEFDLVLFPYENEDGTTIKDVLRTLAAGCSGIDAEGNGAEGGSMAAKPKSIAIIIGPEGGFSDEEADLITEKGGKSVSLGKTILRTETAGMTALAMTMYELEL